MKNLKIQVSLMLLLIFTFVSEYSLAQQKPNIVYILCDDLGYGDVQFLNPLRGKIATPNMDKLAKQSMTFTDAHGGSSVCTPTRYGVLTGRYAWRSRLQNGVLGNGSEFRPLIAPKRLTVASMLKQANYNTACIGKWHLGFHFTDQNGDSLALKTKHTIAQTPVGTRVPDGPLSRGFDYYYGFHHAASIRTLIENDKVIGDVEPIRMLSMLTKKASEYIAKESKKNEPFFLYLALNSPHAPIVPSEKWQGKSKIGTYGDFVMETDDAIGQIMDALKKNGIDKNTLVIVTSDNGISYPAVKGNELETKYGHFGSAQYRGSKSDIWEGGHRIPFIVRWPEVVKPNTRNNTTICETSLMATCAEINGIKIPENAGEDSFSILSLLKGEKSEQNVPMISHSMDGRFAIRDGQWKLEFCAGSGGWTSPREKVAFEMNLPEIQLYNLKKDEKEEHNVYKENPEVVKRLTDKLTLIIENGRSTIGNKQKNDVTIDLYKKSKLDKASLVN